MPKDVAKTMVSPGKMMNKWWVLHIYVSLQEYLPVNSYRYGDASKPSPFASEVVMDVDPSQCRTYCGNIGI
jgi:hypothetical protein